MRARRLLCAGLASLVWAAVASAQEARRVVSKRPPHYPELAKKMNLTGTVKLEVLVGPDGAVKHVSVLGGHPILVNATVDAVKEWKYESARAETVEQINVAFKP